MRALPWVIVAALVAWAVIQGRGFSEAVDRALAAEAAVATLRPLADSLRAEAERKDTVLVAVLDSVRVVVERERVVQVVVVDTIRQHVDSVGAAALDVLLASHAAEVAASEEATRQALLWGQDWKDVAEVNLAGWNAERARGDAWEAAARAQDRRAWYERGVVAAATVGVLLLR